MTRTPQTLTALLAAIALCACGTPLNDVADTFGEAPSDDALDLQVNEEYGALDESDEDANFGDEELENDPELDDSGDEPVDDVVDDAEGNDLLDTVENGNVLIQPRRVRISVLWGHIAPGPAGQPTNWSGSLRAENAALRVKRKVLFEGNDGLLPRDNIREVEFTSHIGPHVDGLLVEVIMHPQLGTSPETPPALVLTIGEHEARLPLNPEMRMGRVIRLGQGYGIAYNVFRPDTGDCKEGMMGGRYIKVSETDDGRSHGRFKGRYISSDGTVAGKIKGVWGQRTNGSKVLFAKIINRQGEFVGVLAGKYGEGQFRARFLGQERRVKGAAHGQYRASENPEVDGGFFRGRWSQNCGELASEGAIDISDEYNDEVDAALEDDMSETDAEGSEPQ